MQRVGLQTFLARARQESKQEVGRYKVKPSGRSAVIAIAIQIEIQSRELFNPLPIQLSHYATPSQTPKWAP
jgi:hypothetical protein